jgi:hypothetical protein
MEEREERFGDSCRDEEMNLTIDASVLSLQPGLLKNNIL